MYESLYGHVLLFLLGKYPKVKWLDHWVDNIEFLKKCLTAFQSACPVLQSH